jgi:peptidyl-tRNA hydrolase
MRIKIYYRKNLKMTPMKLAAQAVHAALGLNLPPESASCSVVVLGASNAGFERVKAEFDGYLVKDAGKTEVEPGTETCFAILEE